MRCGAVLLTVLASLATAFAQTSSTHGLEKADYEETPANSTEKPVYQFAGYELPPFSEVAHGVRSGPITIVDNKTFFIRNLHYDGEGPDAHFWVGSGSQATGDGVLVPDENNSTKPLAAYDGQNVTIRLPGSLTVDKIDYLAVWCIIHHHNFGQVLMPWQAEKKIIRNQGPLGVQLEPFSQLAHGLRSGPIVVVDKQTFFIPNLHYDGKGPDAHFWVGNGSAPSPSGTLVPDENGSIQSISAYSGQNIYITLPHGLTVDQVDYLGVWCIEYKHNFGHMTVPKNLKVPEPSGNPQMTADHQRIIRVQKCCPLDEVLTISGCKTEGLSSFEPVLDVYIHNSTHINDDPLPAQTLRFEPYVNHIRCKHRQYPLFPDDDLFSLLENGSLMILNTQQILSQDNYCLETVDFGDEEVSEWITTAIVCFSSADVPLSNTVFVIYAVGVLISAIFLIITALVFLLVREVRDTRGKCVVFYSVSMAAAFICLASAQFSGIGDDTCATVGFFMQFFLVSSFTWLTMVSWETYYKIRNYDSEFYSRDRRRLFTYIGIGIFVPVLILIISLLADRIPGIPTTVLKPEFGKNSCFFDQKRGTMMYFYVPVGVAIFFSVLLAGLMKWNLVWFQKHRNTDINWLAIRHELSPMFRSCTFLLTVMTLCWVMEVISFVAKSEMGIWTAIDIINSLQGLIVFVIFVLHRPVKDKLCKLRGKRINYSRPEEKPMNFSNLNGTSPSSNHNEFLTRLRHAESMENMAT